jgi:predicted ATPase/DNA-binding SARP family transcriptional activator
MHPGPRVKRKEIRVARLELCLLGPFEATLAGEPITDFETVKVRALAAYLAAEMGRPHYRASLAGLLWPDWPQPSAMRNLRHALAVLRKVIGDRQADPAFLLISRETLQFNQESDAWVDLAAFEQAIRPAQAKSAARLPLRDAMDLYRGPFLEGFSLNDSPAFEEWVLGKREYLNRLALQGLHSLAEEAEAAGNYEQGLVYARRQLELEPWLEDAHRQVMRLLAQDGQRSAALAQYEACQHSLKRELDVQPSAETTRLYEAIRDGEFGKASREDILLALDLQTRPRHNLPARLTSFVGRQREKAEVDQLLASARLVTLTGPGGSGKTRLSLEIAHQTLSDFPDGVWLVELAPLADAALLPQAIASVLGLGEAPGSSITETLTAYLRSKQLLLLLDNCEHLVDDCAQLAHALLVACPGLRILATSREPLHVAGEVTWLVQPLSLPNLEQLPSPDELAKVEAVRLFIERARNPLPSFALDEHNAMPVAQICCWLDGIPLAIELAAARIPVLSPQGIAGRLDEVFRLLVSRERISASRHQTLRAALDWSYNLLSEKEQALFRRLSIFSGGFSLEAAEGICPQDDISLAEVLDLLSQLIDKSLVAVHQDEFQGQRYHLLMIIQQYGLELLRLSEEERQARQRHLAWYTNYATRAEPELHGSDQIAWLRKLDSEHDNFRSALKWWLDHSEGEAGMQLAGALGYYWYVRNYWSEGGGWLEAVLARDHNPPGRPRAWALYQAGHLAILQGEHEKAESLLLESYNLSQVVSHHHAMAWSLFARAWLEGDRGNHTQADQFNDSAYSLFDELDDLVGMAYCLHLKGEDAREMGDYLNAIAFCEKSLAMFRKLGIPGSIFLDLITLSEIRLYQGNTGLALGYAEDALQLTQALGDRRGHSMVLHILGKVAYQQGEFQAAASRLRKAISVFSEVGDKWFLMICLEQLALVASAQGQVEAAARWLGSTEVLRKAFSLPRRPADQPLYERNVAEIQARVGRDAFDLAWEEGCKMTLEQVVDDALAEGG